MNLYEYKNSVILLGDELEARINAKIEEMAKEAWEHFNSYAVADEAIMVLCFRRNRYRRGVQS